MAVHRLLGLDYSARRRRLGDLALDAGLFHEDEVCRPGSRAPCGGRAASVTRIDHTLTKPSKLPAVPTGGMACDTPTTRPHDSGDSGVSPPQAPYAGLRGRRGVTRAVARHRGNPESGAPPAPTVAAQVRQRR